MKNQNNIYNQKNNSLNSSLQSRKSGTMISSLGATNLSYKSTFSAIKQ